MIPVMKSSRKPNPDDVPIILDDGDRFLKIISSEPIQYEAEPDDCETFITFFVIALADGTYKIIQLMKTFKGDDCISKGMQGKYEIPADGIEKEIAKIEIFSKGIEDATGYKIKWHKLDLSKVEGRDAQVTAIEAWGGQ